MTWTLVQMLIIVDAMYLCFYRIFIHPVACGSSRFGHFTVKMKIKLKEVENGVTILTASIYIVNYLKF